MLEKSKRIDRENQLFAITLLRINRKRYINCGPDKDGVIIDFSVIKKRISTSTFPSTINVASRRVHFSDRRFARITIVKKNRTLAYFDALINATRYASA